MQKNLNEFFKRNGIDKLDCFIETTLTIGLRSISFEPASRTQWWPISGISIKSNSSLSNSYGLVNFPCRSLKELTRGQAQIASAPVKFNLTFEQKFRSLEGSKKQSWNQISVATAKARWKWAAIKWEWISLLSKWHWPQQIPFQLTTCQALFSPDSVAFASICHWKLST